MKTKIINGNIIANKIIKDISIELNKILNSEKYYGIPSLSIILVGNNSSSEIYIKNKINKSKILGYKINFYELSNKITEYKLLKLIDTLNKDKLTHGILLQLPLNNSNINICNITSKIIPNKDVDCLNSFNLGKLLYKKPLFRSCTSYGIMTLLKKYKIKLKNIKVLIIGTSIIVGKPISIELINQGCSVTIINKYNKNIKDFVKDADLLIVAVGIPKFILGEWVKYKSILIDVGINKLHNGKIIGDIDINNAIGKSSYITPVPGGIGPITVSILLKNVLKAFKINSRLKI